MKIIIDYKILKGTTRIDIEKLVRVMLLENWEPIGGIAGDRGDLYQAIVKKEEV